jgi:8-oxo-dGTP diphosphatase
MLYRNKKASDPNRNKWIGIGGKCLSDESPEACVKREVFEETNLSLQAPRFCGVVTFISESWEEVMYLFHATSFAGRLQTCDEGEFAWVEKKDMTTLPMWQGDRIFLDLLENNHPFFELKLIYEGDTLKQAILDGKELF